MDQQSFSSKQKDKKRDLLRVLIPSIRVWKTAFAATLSWEIAQWFGSKHPFFAPLAAVLCLQITVEKSIRKGVQRVLGILIGVLIASILTGFIAKDWLGIGLLVLIGLSIGHMLELPEYTFTQIAVSALLVLTVGTESSYGLDRMLQTLIGAGVAIFANMVIVPPDYTPSASASLKQAAAALTVHLRNLSRWSYEGVKIGDGIQLHNSTYALVDDVKDASDQMEKAMHALKFSPLMYWRRRQLINLRHMLHIIELGYIHSMELQRILIEWAEKGGLQEAECKRWGYVFACLAEMVDFWEQKALIQAGSPDQRQLDDFIKLPSLSKEHFSNALVLEAHQLLNDFKQINRLEDRMTPETRVDFDTISDGKGKAHDLTEN